jgi:hypothetical protein
MIQLETGRFNFLIVRTPRTVVSNSDLGHKATQQLHLQTVP